MTAELFGMIRAYARIHGRRHKILLDAHTHGVNIRGKLLFDYHAMPFTRMPLLEVPGEELAWRDWWGYDQIAWFANQPEGSRKHFLEYTYKWTEINNPNAYFELPFRRMIHNAEVSMKRGDNGEMDAQDFYHINTKSAACPMGFDQEETAKRLWATGHSLREQAANPEMLIR